MDYKLSIDNINKVVIATCEGQINIVSVRPMIRELRQKAYELNYGVMYDVSSATLKAKLFDAYQLPRESEDLYESPAHRRGKVAIVYKAEKDFWEFLETTALNSGLLVKVFSERGEAFEWLQN